MILVLGGTTEGRIAVQTLEEAGKPFYYSTKGNEQEVPLHNGIRLQGGMDKDSLESFCRKENISLLIDAAHPFAEELHRNVSETADILQIPVIRYERIYPRIENNEGIVWCDNYEDAIRQIKKGRSLYNTGTDGSKQHKQTESAMDGKQPLLFPYSRP